MAIYIVLFLALIGGSDSFTIEVPAPEYQVLGHEITANDNACINIAGAPKLPCTYLTLAVPPGALVKTVNFYGQQ